MIVAMSGLMLAAPLFLSSQTAYAASSPSVIYEALPSVTPATSYPSQPFQAQQTSEFGDSIHLGGSNRILDKVTVTMEDWALYSQWSSDPRYSGNSADWTLPMTLNVYSTHLNSKGVPDDLLAATTQTVSIPWRPAEDATNCPTTYGGVYGWQDSTGACHYGVAANVTFDLSSQLATLPDNVIVTVAFNTQSYGSSPIGSDGPYNSLNVAVPPSQAVTVGNDSSTDAVFWNTRTCSYYSDSTSKTTCNGGNPGLMEDTNWTPYGTVPFEITALPANPSTVYVNSDWSAVSNGQDPDGSGPAAMMGYDAFSTIQAAINAVAPGGTVIVASGTYTGTFTIAKDLTLQGNQAGVDARSRSASETVLSTSSGNNITVSSGTVTIDGFEFENTGSGAGISILGGSGDTIQNNIFSNMKGYAANGDFASATIEKNLVKNTNIGFESNTVAGDGATITANSFTGDTNYDIGFIQGGSGIVISNNQSSNEAANFVALFKATGAQITGNNVTGLSYSVVFLGGDNSNINISENSFTGNASNAITVSNYISAANGSITISGNNLSSNTRGISVGSGALSGNLTASSNNNLAGNSSYGIYNDAASGGTVDATLNYWGGDPSTMISGSVNYAPYYTNTSMTTRSDAKVVPDSSGNATADNTTPTVVVSSDSTPVNVTVTSGTSNAKIDYSALKTSSTTAVVPQTTIQTQNASVQIQAGTTITASGSWDGTVTAPTIQSAASVSVPTTSGTITTVGTVIEVGAGDTTLTFDKAARLVIPGQAGTLVGFQRGGDFTQITNVCSADNQAAGNALPAGGDCYINVGSDMVVWTKHFTKFVTYTKSNTYTVQSGDTMSSIAAKTGLTLAQLEALNPNAGHPAGNFDLILPGDVLRLGNAVLASAQLNSTTASESTGSSSQNGVLGSSANASQPHGTALSTNSTKKSTTASTANPAVSGKGLAWYWWGIIAVTVVAALLYLTSTINSRVK